MNTPNFIPDKPAELAIAQAERRFREVFERSPAWVWMARGWKSTTEFLRCSATRSRSWRR